MVDGPDHTFLAVPPEQADRRRGERETAPLHRGKATPAVDQDREETTGGADHPGPVADLTIEPVEEGVRTRADLLDRLTSDVSSLHTDQPGMRSRVCAVVSPS